MSKLPIYIYHDVPSGYEQPRLEQYNSTVEQRKEFRRIMKAMQKLTSLRFWKKKPRKSIVFIEKFTSKHIVDLYQNKLGLNLTRSKILSMQKRAYEIDTA